MAYKPKCQEHWRVIIGLLELIRTASYEERAYMLKDWKEARTKLRFGTYTDTEPSRERGA